ncbi:hypothetical protein nACB1_056 [Acinetobacter phage nACB1]|nr:hypothetical protein nACB1_056 [Acinetobacter phage nACB1]
MSFSRSHVMASNQRLINQINRDLFGQANKAWERVYTEFCKRHGELMPNRVMQFKYKGVTYFIEGDTVLRSGVQQLHESLKQEFNDAYQMFVVELSEEARICQNMVSHAIRIAKYAEDLLELLPECMHAAINEAGFFQMESKPLMSLDDVKAFKDEYEQYFTKFDMRVLLGATM